MDHQKLQVSGSHLNEIKLKKTPTPLKTVFLFEEGTSSMSSKSHLSVFSNEKFRQASNSLGNHRLTKIQGLKDFSTKVHVPWYRRYYEVLPDDEQCSIQPRNEIYDPNETEEQTHSFNKGQMPAVRTSIEEKELDMFKKKLFSSISNEKKIVSPLAGHLAQVRRKTIRSLKEYDKLKGRWLKVIKPDLQLKIRKRSIEARKEKARIRFVKVINVIKCYNAFLKQLKDLHYSSDLNIGLITQNAEVVHSNQAVFDVEKYKTKSKIEDGSTIPFNVKMILTKPWFVRTLQEVEEVVEALYCLFIFIKYPANVAKQMARVAWYTKLGSRRPILRQSDRAECFCLLISGAAKAFSLSYDSFGRPVETIHRIINRGQLFGEDDLATHKHIRKESVTTTEITELMTIDFNDYQDSLLCPMNNTKIPNHIKTIKKETKLKNVPLIEMLSSAKDFLPCMYYPNHSIIADSLRDSDYVFLVLQGECYSTYAPIKESPPRSKRYLDFKDEVRRSTYQLRKESERQLQKMYFTTLIKHAKETFQDDIKHLCEVSLTKPKEEMIKEIRPGRITRYYTDTEDTKYERSISEEIVKKMCIYEKGNEEYISEIKQMQKKITVLEKAMEYLKKIEIKWSPEQENALDEYAQQHLAGVAEPLIQNLKTNKNLGQVKILTKEDAEYNTCTQDAESSSILRKTVNERTSKHMKKFSAVHFGPSSKKDEHNPGLSIDISEKENDDQQFRFSSCSKADTFEATTPNPLQFASQSFNGEDNKRRESSESHKEQMNTSFCFQKLNVNDADGIDDGGSTDDTEGKMGKRSLKECDSFSNADERFVEETSRRNTKMAGKKLRRVEIFRKNQFAGDQYVDYNDGKFRVQPIDLALISTGVEVVMVSKAFLRSYLCSHW